MIFTVKGKRKVRPRSWDVVHFGRGPLFIDRVERVVVVESRLIIYPPKDNDFRTIGDTLVERARTRHKLFFLGLNLFVLAGVKINRVEAIPVVAQLPPAPEEVDLVAHEIDGVAICRHVRHILDIYRASGSYLVVIK